MPFKSEAQRKAMYAAASGHGNIGIPKQAAEKFIKHSTDSKTVPFLLTPKMKVDSTQERREQLKGISHMIGDIVGKVAQLKGEFPKTVTETDGEIVPRFGETEEKTDAANIHTVEEPAPVVVPIDKDAGAKGRSAGIMFQNQDGRVLFIRRGDGGDYPRTWAVPGGHENHEDKSLEDAARRECLEETGINYEGPLEVLHDNGQFCTYIARNVNIEEAIKLNYESSGYDWSHPEDPPFPLHPSQEISLKVALAKTETDIAQLIADGTLASPQLYANIGLFAIRITGTGLAYRAGIGENVWRDPSLYLNDEFLKRCNGLMVIMDHPSGSVLNTEEFAKRAVGSIMLPYIKGDEVWGIAKIYDKEAISEICEGEVSTSPAVVFDNTAGNTTLTTENGDPLLIEGVPFLLDHIAIVTKARGSKGVWDKGGEPAGVLLTNPEVSKND